MMLVDSSVWIEHLRRADARLHEALNGGQVLTHPFVIGELALGSLRKRGAIVSLLQDLPSAALADDLEVLDFINRHALFGMGIGYVDAHLLASARLTGATLWTHDKRLHEAALKLRLAHAK